MRILVLVVLEGQGQAVPPLFAEELWDGALLVQEQVKYEHVQ